MKTRTKRTGQNSNSPIFALVVFASLFVLVQAGQTIAQETTLFTNVRIFNGKTGTLSPPSNVLVSGNKIEKISTSPITAIGPPRVIDGRGMTLMPGLIDMHWHAMLIRSTPADLMGGVGYVNFLAADEAKDTLMRGFTTVRDVGGPVFDL